MLLTIYYLIIQKPMSPRKSEEDIIKIKVCTLQFQIIGERSLNKKGGGGGAVSNRYPKYK